ncbi:MAG: hypothetical protein AAF824_04085 [Bacteroidota bacterium]
MVSTAAWQEVGVLISHKELSPFIDYENKYGLHEEKFFPVGNKYDPLFV